MGRTAKSTSILSIEGAESARNSPEAVSPGPKEIFSLSPENSRSPSRKSLTAQVLAGLSPLAQPAH